MSCHGCGRRPRSRRYLNALPYNTEPAGATLRSFRGVVAHGHGALLRSGDVRRGRAGAARLSAARPELRVDRPPGSRAVRLPPRRPLGIGRALARSRPARTTPGLRDAARAGAELRRPVRRLHAAASKATRSPTCASWGPTTGGSHGATSGRPSGSCSTTRISAITPVARRARRRCARATARSATRTAI